MEMTIRQTRFSKWIAVASICIAIITFFSTLRRISILEDQLELATDQVEIMRQSLERKVNLIMTIVPSYDVTVIGASDGTVEVRNSTLLLSRTENFTFTLYASNIGDAFAHILFCSVVINCDLLHPYTSIEIPFTDNIVLKPNDSISFEYLFTPLKIPTDTLLNASDLILTFTLGSAETSVYKNINAQFVDNT